MEQETKKIKKSINLYPIFYTFSADLIFLVPIDTLFFTLTKGLNASQISAMTTISLLICIITQKYILKIIKKIGNVKSTQLGAFLLFLASVILVIGKSFTAMIIYRSIYELAFMFWGMTSILLRNDLIYIGREKEYFAYRNKAKVLYGIGTMITALISGYLYNLNEYLPIYISIIIHFTVFMFSFNFYEPNIEVKTEAKPKSKKINMSYIILLILLSNTLFYSLIKTGQSNSKLFMQYDFHEFLSTEMVTYYITTIVFLSRIARIIGNMIFGKIYEKRKDNMSNILTVLLFMAFALSIIGHFIQFNFIFKVILMSSGFFLILAIRDSFQVYIEDTALRISNKDEQQKILVNIEVYRKWGQLILSGLFALILIKYDLIVVVFILLVLAAIEIIVNKKMCLKLEGMKKLNE